MIIIFRHIFLCFHQADFFQCFEIVVFQHFIQAVERHTGFDSFNDFFLTFQNNIINQFLSFGEFTTDGECTGNVPCIIAPLGTCINKDQFTILHFLIIFVIMKNCTSFAASRNGAKGSVFHAILFQHIIISGFHFIFHHACFGSFHHFFNAKSCDVHGLSHAFQFPIFLDDTHFCKIRIQVTNDHMGGLSADFFRKFQRGGQCIVPFSVFQIQPHFLNTIFKDICCKIRLKRINNGNICDTADFCCFFCSHVCAIPFCHITIISGDIQCFLYTISCFCHKQDTIFSVDPCQIVKIAVRRERISFVPSFIRCFSCKNHRHRIHFNTVQQFFSVLFECFFHLHQPFTIKIS